MLFFKCICFSGKEESGQPGPFDEEKACKEVRKQLSIQEEANKIPRENVGGYESQ